MVKKGDTLIEVTLAIGIFSMVAIVITSVMSGSAANTQTALEATLAREAVDTQAEALRFIQASYAVNKNGTYKTAWNNIMKASYGNDLIKNPNSLPAVTSFNPTNCANMYPSTTSNAFIIDPTNLNVKTYDSGDLNPTMTYPQVTLEKKGGKDVAKAYGIYIISVPEQTNSATKTPTYYDFYIRTCWYGSNANEPSTISTVIRLANPDAI